MSPQVVLQYFSSASFAWATVLSLLVMMVAGRFLTGPTSGNVKQQINYSSSENRKILLGAFVLAEIVINVLLII